jgi:hypothetical protein
VVVVVCFFSATLSCSDAGPPNAVPFCSLQGDCQTREEAVTLGVGLCNNGFMHHGNPQAGTFLGAFALVVSLLPLFCVLQCFCLLMISDAASPAPQL